jgi:hypothetical protein
MFGPYISSLPGYGPYAEGILKVGITESITVAQVLPTGTTIWGENVPYPWDWTPAQLSFASTSPNDTFGGSGANVLYVSGLDMNYLTVNETIQLNGTTPVITQNTYTRVNECFVALSGASTWNEGIIRGTSGADVAVRVDIFTARSNQAVYTIPGDWANGGLLLRYWSDMSNKQVAVAISRLKFRLPGSNTWQILGGFAASNNSGVVDYIAQVPLPLPPLTDFDGVLTDLSTNGISMIATLEFMRHS